MSVQRPPSEAAWDSSQCEPTEYCPPRCPRFVDEDGRSMLIRQPEPADHDRLRQLYDEFDDAHRAQGLPPTTDERLEEWLSRTLEEGRNFVADYDGRIVGHSFYTPADHPEPELAVFVHHDHHGRGIGTELCKHVVATGAATDRDAIVLEVERRNRVAVHIYQELGFETVRDGRELLMRRSFEEDEENPFRRSNTAEA
ncbi:GNAT family N-acetyltransferase [Natronobacterium texcoconense]|uniref:Acetyltransferase (GNAT) family protein n=1 Tax=Natronobacterium texcoconense TaxID=1095778 RepID=A0A1H1HWK5_NATTX|nr:GNAT family N-acetyltransferase [Natronobacterium texcoconense]SDR29793.1 Acetyltransferase (GNAT) family protein [Natronobacterium texcoconense]